MAKKNLPVILLKGIVLLPSNEVRLEFNTKEDKKILDKAFLFHNNQVLIVCTLDDVKQKEKLPKIGILGRVKNTSNINRFTMKATIDCIRRLEIERYLDDENSQVLEAIISEEIEVLDEEKVSIAFTRKIIREMENYTNQVDYLNHEVINRVVSANSLGKMVDMFVTYIPLAIERRIKYLETLSETARAQMLLEDMQKELEIMRLEDQIEGKLKQQLDENQKEYILREKVRIIKEELGDISSKDTDTEELKKKIDALKAPKKVKDKLLQELKKYEFAPSMSPENSVIRTYIDTLLNLPWKSYSKDAYDFKEVTKVLDESHYGLEQVKVRITEYLAVQRLSKDAKAPILCLVGPPGTGKTSLAMSIAKAINRKFVKISVGGVNDESELIGHRRTYIGANPGRIINGIKKVGVANPLFLIDEIDKMTKDYKGDPASVLLEVLDPEQNMHFSDNYVEEEFDLSKVMFICTANYLHDIPEPLKDRLEIIELSGYTEFEKLDIVKKHILPKKLNEYGLSKYKIQITDKAIMQIIRGYTKEAGVRELDRLIGTILRKIAVQIVEKQNKENYQILEKDLIDYLGKQKFHDTKNETKSRVGVVNGLAYTTYGGDILPIEVTYYPGKGDLILTGKLGEVMKESAKIALSYLKSHAKEYGIDYELLTKNDIHIHAPEGAIPKDGPSAGITLVTALISAFTKQRVSSNIGMTGEITLRGSILPIGGLKEKAMGAYRAGVKTIIIPEENVRDIDEVPKEIKDKLNFIPVQEYDEVLKIVSQNKKRNPSRDSIVL